MHSDFRRYCLIFAVCTMCGLAGVAGLNLLIDPIGAYPTLSLRVLERIGTKLFPGRPRARWWRVTRATWYCSARPGFRWEFP